MQAISGAPLTDYANAIELYGKDKRGISERVFVRMASAYAALGQYCEATTPILTWVALDPTNRDNSASQKIIADYERRGNCSSFSEFRKERYALQGQRNVVTVKATINDVQGTFILDTGASYVSVKAGFAQRANIPKTNSEIRLTTANGQATGELSKAEKVSLGRLEARDVPVVVQKTDEKGYGPRVDGLLGMSFLSRFEIQLAGGFIEIRTRSRK